MKRYTIQSGPALSEPSATRRFEGFTLIELLVVIAIIGVLSTTVLVSLGGVRSQARDARRQADLRQISTAMELDYNDDGRYSTSDTVPAKIPCQGDPPTCTGSNDGSYLDPLPSDPAGSDYMWLDNRLPTDKENCDDQSFTVYIQLEGGTFFVASPRGTREVAEEPAACP